MPMSTSVVSSKQKWKEFLTRYYKPEIQQLAVSDAKTKSLYVDYQDIVRFDVRLGEELVMNPGKVLKDAEDALPLVDLPVKRKLSAFIRIVKLPGKTMIRDIRSGHVNTLVSVDCIVRNITGVTQRIIVGAFECARCGNVVYLPQEGTGKFLEPNYCTCNEEKKGVFRLLFKESTFEDYQRVQVQESLEDLPGGAQPQNIECNLNNDLAGQLTPGDRIIINGILRSQQKIKKDGKSTSFDYHIDVNGFERDREELDELVITDEDEAEIRKHAMAVDVFDRVENSIAPSIYGHGHVKRAIAFQLFGGVVKHLPGGARIRGDIHVLWLGDPAVAKSQVLAAAVERAPRGMLTTGQGSSAAGLTAATVPDEFSGGGYVLEAGVLVLASPQGFVAVDEIDKMRQDDRKKIHGALEQQIVKVDRAGIHATMRSECSVLAAGNPIEGRWVPEESIAEQINLDPAIMSRFDLTFLSQDLPDEETDKAISGHILSAHRGDTGKLTPVVDSLLLKKWIALARRKIFPKMNDHVAGRLQKYYLEKRNQSKNSTIKITARSLDGLVRLCEAAARIRLSPEIEDRDVDAVLELVDISIKQTCRDENGETDVDVLTVGVGKSQRERKINLKNQIRALAGGNTRVAVSIEAIIEECGKQGMKPDTVQAELDKLREIGQIWMTPDGNGVMLT